ncbi:MAG: Flp pilus assembly complex ATPase component TadA [Deltaproteobacteria bacterium]|nr:Flp pilus assembly complex ATPase component TadA [Deltaproteobacteria bacterium]
MKKKKLLGKIFLEAGLLSEEQLDQALEAQKRSGMKLGQIFIQQGIISEFDLIEALCRHFKLTKYHPDDYSVDTSLKNLIPSEEAQKYQVAPLIKKGRLLKIAISNPSDIETLDAIETLTNSEIEPVVCTDWELTELMGRIYGKHSALGGVMESMDEIPYNPDEITGMEEVVESAKISSLQDMAEQVPVVRLVNSIISHAVRQGASDIHISPEKDYVHTRFRIDGTLHEVPSPSKAMLLPIISRLKILSNMDISKSRIAQDGRFTIAVSNKEINVRTSVIPTIYGENLVMRLLDMSTGFYTLDRLGMGVENRKKIEDLITKPYGMILSTGPTGSGKSTSLYALLKEMNKSDVNIITVEDPVEYRMKNVRQLQLNRKAGMTFAGGLKAILRQDPDIIMVGEIRDAETARIAVRSAMTGHMVLSTVHTNDAAGSIVRLLDLEIEPFLVSSVMLASFAQRLIRTVCSQCKKSYRPSDRVLVQWGLEKMENTNFQRGTGCFSCMNTGFKGRTGIFEVLVMDDMVQDMILQKKSAQEITRSAQQAGTLKTIKDDAIAKVVAGITTIEEAASSVRV